MLGTTTEYLTEYVAILRVQHPVVIEVNLFQFSALQFFTFDMSRTSKFISFKTPQNTPLTRTTKKLHVAEYILQRIKEIHNMEKGDIVFR